MRPSACRFCRERSKGGGESGFSPTLFVEADALLVDWTSLGVCLVQAVAGEKAARSELEAFLRPGVSLLEACLGLLEKKDRSASSAVSADHPQRQRAEFLRLLHKCFSRSRANATAKVSGACRGWQVAKGKRLPSQFCECWREWKDEQPIFAGEDEDEDGFSEFEGEAPTAGRTGEDSSFATPGAALSVRSLLAKLSRVAKPHIGALNVLRRCLDAGISVVLCSSNGALLRNLLLAESSATPGAGGGADGESFAETLGRCHFFSLARAASSAGEEDALLRGIEDLKKTAAAQLLSQSSLPGAAFLAAASPAFAKLFLESGGLRRWWGVRASLDKAGEDIWVFRLSLLSARRRRSLRAAEDGECCVGCSGAREERRPPGVARVSRHRSLAAAVRGLQRI